VGSWLEARRLLQRWNV